jgi:hypothetical protein
MFNTTKLISTGVDTISTHINNTLQYTSNVGSTNWLFLTIGIILGMWLVPISCCCLLLYSSDRANEIKVNKKKKLIGTLNNDNDIMSFDDMKKLFNNMTKTLEYLEKYFENEDEEENKEKIEDEKENEDEEENEEKIEDEKEKENKKKAEKKIEEEKENGKMAENDLKTRHNIYHRD